MSENREQILADFQACTGIEDVGEAIFHLEESNWDLLAAINRVMPQETQTLPSEMDVDVEMIEETKQDPSSPVKSSPDVTVVSCIGSDCPLPFQLPISVSADVIPLPSTSQSESSTRLLQFHIHFREKVIQLQLPDTGTVGDLKTLLTAQLRIPTCQQGLEGWKQYPSSDFTTLTSLNLPRENILFLTIPHTKDGELSTEDSNIADRLTQSYTLNVHDESHQKKYSLKFLGSKTVLEVKTDVYTLTDIPVRHQVWTGWPSQLKSDRTTLACSGIRYPVHEFTIKRAPFTAQSAKDNKKFIVDLADSDNSSVEEFEDASETFTEDDIFVDVETKRMQPLIPNNVEDETAGCIHFADQFTNRYGECHPEFFPGSLDEAVKEACLKPGSNAKAITDISAKKDSPSKHVKIPALKRDELKVCSSKPQDVKVFTCKMDNTSGMSKGLLHKVLHSASAEKMEKSSVVSDFKMVPASVSALASEKVSDYKLLELKDKNDVNSSPLRTVGDPSELKINADMPKGVAKQAQFIVPAKGKLVKVKLQSSAAKTPASDCGLLFVSKSKSESSIVGQPSCSPIKHRILYIKKTLGTKSSLPSDHHTGGSETVGRVQPAPGRSVFSLDSKMPRLEEVKISNNRPVVRILNASSDSHKSTNTRAGASVSSASLVFIRKEDVLKEGGSANTSPVILKRKRSFETEPAVGHRPREECPPVSHKTYMHVKPKELKIIDAEPNIKKKKVLADAASVSSNTASVQEVSDKLLSMSVEIVKKEHEKPNASQIPERAEEQPLPDGSINERNFTVNSENAFVKSATSQQNYGEKRAPEAITNLGLEKGIVVKALKPEAVTITADSPLVRKRRALSDTLVCGDINRSEGHVVSKGKRRKLSVSDISSLAEETLKSETVIETAGITKVARSPPTRRVPITSTMEVTISPLGVEQNVQTLPVCKSEQCEVNDDDLEMEKDDPGKEFMQAKVVLEKLPMPVPGCLLTPPAQVKIKVKPEPQSLQKALESVSVILQATLPDRSVGNQKLLELKKLQDELAEPAKKQKIVKREMLQNKTTGKPPQQKIMGKQAEQKIVRKQTQPKTVGKQSQEKTVRKQTAQKIIGKQKTVGKQTQQKIIGKQTQQRSMGKQNKQTVTGKQSQQKVLRKQASQTVIRKQSQQKIVKRLSQQKVIGRPPQHKYAGKPQHKVLGKSSQRKVIGRAYPQKITNKPMQQQKTLSKQKSIQKTSPRNVPSIAVRIASKKKKKKETPKKVVSSGNKTKPQKMEPSITAKKTMKSAGNQGPEAVKRIITMKEKSVNLNKNKEKKFDRKEEMIVPPKNEKMTFEGRKKENEPPEMKIVQSAMKTVEQEKPVAMKRLPGPKKIVSNDRRMKKSQGISMEPSEPNGCNTAADDEWIVEVLLDDSEVNMMTVISQVQVGQETHSSSVSSSDDKPKDLDVSTRNLDGNHLLECDSSTDLHRRSEAVGGGGEARRNISASKSNPRRTTLNANVKQKVALPSIKQVMSSVNNAKRTGISTEQKMAEMRKAIGDLERIADRCMLRLKAQERQVSLLTSKLHQYENDKHYNMLSKILKDAAPGPKQNPHAEFILDLLLSYCPDDDDSGCQETLPAPV